MNTPATANFCPICGKYNLCAMQLEHETGVKQAACWCTTVVFDEALLALVPTEKLNLACICQACVNQANSKNVSIDSSTKP